MLVETGPASIWLLLIEWIGPSGPWDDQLLFIFDGGALSPEQIADLKLSDPELSAYQFATVVAAADLLRPDVYDRLRRALCSLADDTTSYDETDRNW